MHGVKRNAAIYRDNWIKLAIQNNLIIIAPEFSEKDYPGSKFYNLGNYDEDNFSGSKTKSLTFSAIEEIFSIFKEKFPLGELKYNIFGHSAGAQFVHRFVLFGKYPRMDKAIAANAGWYTFPNTNIDFPYGLKGVDQETLSLKKRLLADLTILLGTEDNDPNHKFLRRTREANWQGAHRLERGLKFLNEAKKRHPHTNWKLSLVEGVSHENAKMANAAVKLFFK